MTKKIPAKKAPRRFNGTAGKFYWPGTNILRSTDNDFNYQRLYEEKQRDAELSNVRKKRGKG